MDLFHERLPLSLGKPLVNIQKRQGNRVFRKDLFGAGNRANEVHLKLMANELSHHRFLDDTVGLDKEDLNSEFAARGGGPLKNHRLPT